MSEDQSCPKPDIELLDKALSGDEEARYELAIRASKLIYYYAYQNAEQTGLHWARQDYEDFNQDLLVSLFKNDCRKLRSFQRRSAFTTWLLVIVRHALIDRKRRAATRQDEQTRSMHDEIVTGSGTFSIEDLLHDLAANPAEKLLYKSLVAAVREAVSEVVSSEDKLILEHWGSRRLTEKELGLLLGMNENTIASRLHRAQAKILKYLKEKGADSVL